MYKLIYKIIFLFTSVILLSSCEDVIQIKLDKGGKLVVIDAFVDDLRKPQVVRVLNNTDYFSDQSSEPISNAQVVLKDLTANKSYTFTYAGNGNYQFNITPADTIAKPNHQYELNVTVNGTLYKALATQKRRAIASKIDLKKDYSFIDTSLVFLGIMDTLIEQTPIGNGPAEKFYTTLLFAVDIADNNPDYYRIKTFRNDTLFNKTNDLLLCIDGTGGEVYNSPDPFNLFSPPVTFLGFQKYQKNDKCKAEIHSLSKEAYNFFLQAQLQVTNSGLFATTPENVRTNIISPTGATKGVGWFNMASVTTTSLVMGL